MGIEYPPLPSCCATEFVLGQAIGVVGPKRKDGAKITCRRCTRVYVLRGGRWNEVERPNKTRVPEELSHAEAVALINRLLRAVRQGPPAEALAILDEEFRRFDLLP